MLKTYRETELVQVTKTGFVYLIINSSGRVKIGSSDNPQKRLKQLQTGNSDKLKLLHVIRCNRPSWQVERRIQSWFLNHRQEGEWFSLPKETINWLCSLTEDFDIY